MHAPRILAPGLSVLALACFGALAACASPKAAAPPATPADVPAESAAPEAAKPSAEAPAAKREAPAGELACRASSPTEGTSELFLTWESGAAKGVLRTVAPSGERSTQKVLAERHQGMIVADDPHEKDLTVHAAMVRPIKGKAHMRLGGATQVWTPCE